MLRLRILAVFALTLAVIGSYAFVSPSSASTGDQTAVTMNDGDNGSVQGDPADNGGEKKPEAKRDRPPSYKDKLEGRNKPKASRKPPQKPKYKKWKDVLKDSEAQEGLFTIHTKREDVFFELKETDLDKPYLAILTLSQGMGTSMVFGGLVITELMFDFHRVEDHVQIRMLNTRFRASDDPELQKALELSYGNSILANLPIMSENTKDKAVLVQMNKFFLSDISDVGFFLQLVLRKPVRMDPKKGVFRKIKSYPNNIEIDALLTYSPADRRGLNLPSVPDNRFIEIGVHYSLNALPEEPMKPRLADDRVGYFLTPHKDFTRDEKESFFVHYVNRWRLEKQDPTADLSEPIEPLVYYIDSTVPQKYRKYVREGIEMWQRAFEAAGYKNAIIAMDAPTPEEDPDYDPEDARYNTVRWIVSDNPSFGAIGPSSVDPRTGEILDADILIEQSMIMGFRINYRRFAGPEAIGAVDPMLQHIENPEENEEAAHRMELQQYMGHRCGAHFGTGFANGFDFMSLALLADGVMEPGMDVPREYVGEAIKFVVCHEVGHTLGLRHNFKSSAATPFAQLNDRYKIGEIGMAASIMDYPSPNVSRDRSRQGFYYSPTVGTYDQWAIEWGYSTVPGGQSVEKEAIALRKIADESSLKAHTYATDEDTYPAGALDPLSAIWDLSDDPLAWAQERVGLCEDIVASGQLEERVVGDGSNYVPLRGAATTLIMQKYIAVSKAVKYVGGQYTARPHKGANDGEMPLMPVPAAKQREALAFIVEHGFANGAFALPPEMMNMLADDKMRDWQNPIWAYGRRFDFPMIGWVGAVQNALLRQLLQPMLLQRVAEAEYKVEDPYRLSELFAELTKAIWYDNLIADGQTAMLQRNLQRIYLHHLIAMTVRPAGGTPHEAVALARLHMTRLQSQLDTAAKKSGLSDETAAHLLESKARVDRALDAKLQSSY